MVNAYDGSGNALVYPLAAAALDHLLTRRPGTTLAVPSREIEWRSGFRHRGPLSVPIVLG